MRFGGVLEILLLVTIPSSVWTHYRLNPGINNLPRDCSELGEELVRVNYPRSGVYLIDPDGRGAFDVFCRFRQGKGYTVFQRRMNGEEDFNRTWTEYALGFGDLDSEHWLGLERLHRLTQNAFRCNRSELHISLRAFSGQTYMAEYDYFKVLGENQNYKVFTGGFKGSAGDSFKKAEGNKWTSNWQSDPWFGRRRSQGVPDFREPWSGEVPTLTRARQYPGRAKRYSRRHFSK